MAKIIDPDDLNQNVEVTITPGTSGTIKLNRAGNLSDDGVTMQCLYSFLKEEWKDDDNLIKFPFPQIAITNEQFEFIDNWDFTPTSSAELVRDGGWAVKGGAGESKKEFINLTTLGSFVDAVNDRAYYLQIPASAGGTLSYFVYAGPVNEAVQVYSSPTQENYDYRGYFKAFLREEAKTYDSYDLLTEQNITALTYKKYALPLSNASDAVKITHTDAQIASGADYANIDISYYPAVSAAQQRDIGGTLYDFHVIIEGDNKTAEQIYEKVQYLLRQNKDIDQVINLPTNIPVSGATADELLTFIGDTLRTGYVPGYGGVYIDNFATADINRLEFTDDTQTIRIFPFTATGALQFNSNLVDDTDAYYWMFFTSIGASAYGTSDAILVQDSNSEVITGAASAASISYTFDYDSNNQGGRTPKTDAPVTVVAIGLATAQYVRTTATIERSTGNNISLVAALERNYLNP